MTRIKALFQRYGEMLLYLFFGGCTTLVNIFAYYLCSRMGLSIAFSTVAAWIFSVLFAYITNRIFVFKSKSYGFTAVFKETANFFLCRSATGLLDLVIMVVFADILRFNGMIVKIISNVIVIVLNYAASKLLIFKNNMRK